MRMRLFSKVAVVKNKILRPLSLKLAAQLRIRNLLSCVERIGGNGADVSVIDADRPAMEFGDDFGTWTLNDCDPWERARTKRPGKVGLFAGGIVAPFAAVCRSKPRAN